MPKSRILRGKPEIARVFERGIFVAGRYFDLAHLRDESGGEFKIAFAASRRARNAVERNRIKRRLREAFRLEQFALAEGRHTVVIGHVKLLRAEFEAVRAELRRAFTIAGLATMPHPR